MSCHKATFRFYEELNDFLPAGKAKTTFSWRFEGHPSVKDVIEAIGVPHAEVDLILVNGQPVDFTCKLNDADFVSVYPVFESFDISTATHLCGRPLRKMTFILDVHLGKLARYLRLFGFDVIYKTENDDNEIIRTALSEHRLILTRDVGLLKVKAVTHGYWIRSQQPKDQLREVLDHFDLYGMACPFSRCVACNGQLVEVEKASVMDRLEPLTKKYFDEFYLCSNCGGLFWKGSHYD
ncbi:MAG: Mut7-C RNAse domain-containing protein, partial [Bacteroidota bacterium]|nr:Mut7-C RNAse domain-containing protein [Bacteroidota bacterium]